jgi:hypothetical protein
MALAIGINATSAVAGNQKGVVAGKIHPSLQGNPKKRLEGNRANKRVQRAQMESVRQIREKRLEKRWANVNANSSKRTRISQGIPKQTNRQGKLARPAPIIPSKVRVGVGTDATKPGPSLYPVPWGWSQRLQMKRKCGSHPGCSSFRQ